MPQGWTPVAQAPTGWTPVAQPAPDSKPSDASQNAVVAFPPRGPQPIGSSDTHEGAPSALEQILGPLAHPQTLTDFARLLTLPVDSVKKALAGALTAAAARPVAASALTATGKAMETAGTVAQKPADIASAIEAISSPKKAALTFAIPRLVKGAGTLLQRGGAALAEKPPAAVMPTIGEAAEAPVSAPPTAPAPAPVAAAPVAAPVAEAAPVANALPNQKLLNELAIQARRAGVKLTPDAEKAAIEAVGKGATPAEAVKAVATPAEAAPAWTPAKIRLTAEESKVAAKLIQEGKTDEEVQTAIETARAFQKRFGTPTPTATQKRFPKGMRGKSSGD